MLITLNRNTINTGFHWLLLFFSFTISLSPYVNVRILVLLVIFSLLKVGLWNLRQFWDIVAYLLVLFLGLSYSEDSKIGLRVLETNFSLIATSIVSFQQGTSDQRKLSKLFYAFAGGLLLTCLICLAGAFVHYIQTKDIQVFFFYNLTELVDSHPTYLAYYLIFSLSAGLYLLYYEQLNEYRLFTAISIFFFFIMLILTGGQTAFISLLLIFSFFILKYLIEEKTKSKNMVLAIVVVMLAAIFLVNSSDYWSGYQIIKGDYWERSALWEAAIKANSNPFFGVGTGDYKQVLNDYYRSHGLSQFANESFNAHNQFIQIYLSNGILGLISLVILLGRPLYLAMRNQDPLGILVFFPFIIYGMNEVFLGRYQGVVFFALLHQVFITHYKSARPSILLKAG